MGRVEGKIALITGGGSGLGRAFALRLAEEGARVIVTDLNVAGGEETVGLVESAGGKAAFRERNVTEEGDWESLMDWLMAEYSRLDILINNAGIILMRSIEDMTLEDFRRQNAVNIEGVFLGMKYGVGAMKKSGGGSIINMSSVAGITGSPMATGYCASKGAVRMMTKAVAKEMNAFKTGIRVNSVHPALIDTPMAASINEQLGNPQRMEEAVERIQGRYGTAEEVAEGIVFLASDESRFMTGSELVIDGGQTA